MDETNYPLPLEQYQNYLPGAWERVAFWVLCIVQITLIVHIFKTGRSYWWCWFLLIAPGLGAIVYILVEVLPEMRQGGRHSFISSLKPRSLVIKEMQAALEESDTVERRTDLAQELFLAGRIQEAHDVVAECLDGVFHNDQHLLIQVIRYKVELGRSDETLQLLGKISGKLDRRVELTMILLRARAYELQGKNAEAIELLKPILGAYLGEEPRYYMAVGLAATGQREEARVIWRDIKTKFRKANKLWRRSEKRWYKLAGEQLKK